MNQHAHAYTMPVRVYFQDTDAGGVVYHASYVNFLERARTEWLRDCCGHSSAGFMKEFGLVFVVRSLKLEYFKPALLDDLLTITTKVRETGRSRILLTQDVMRGEKRLVEAEVQLVCVEKNSFKPVSLPEILRKQWKE